MVAINSLAPAFSLPGLDGRTRRLEKYRGQLVALCFWSANCPWSARVDRALGKWPAELATSVVILRVAMNADETAEEIRRQERERFRDILVLDSDRKVTDAYGAQITPEFFLLDRVGLVRYHGAFDDTTFRQRTPTRPYLENALRALLAGRAPDPAETPAYGCAIVRWKI
jgi:peroxiredoxin